MSKEVKIKSNGLRNELKEIRRSIDKLTEALVMIHLTNTRTDENTSNIVDDIHNEYINRKRKASVEKAREESL
jgi:hypothetical protein